MLVLYSNYTDCMVCVAKKEIKQQRNALTSAPWQTPLAPASFVLGVLVLAAQLTGEGLQELQLSRGWACTGRMNQVTPWWLGGTVDGRRDTITIDLKNRWR